MHASDTLIILSYFVDESKPAREIEKAKNENQRKVIRELNESSNLQ